MVVVAAAAAREEVEVAAVAAAAREEVAVAAVAAAAMAAMAERTGPQRSGYRECPHPSVTSFCPRPDHVASSQPLPHKSCIERVQVERGGRSRLYVCTLSSWLYHVP